MIRLAAAPANLARNARALMLVGALACAGLLATFLVDPRTSARALLYAWLYWIGLAAGSMVLLLAHALTGGGWGQRARPALAPPSRALCFLAAPFIVVVLLARLIYPWAGPVSPVGIEVARLYLNPYAFAARGVAIVALWAALGIAIGRGRRLTPLWAGIGLALYLLSVTVAAIDWSASLVPQWSSSAYGMLIGVSQVTAALAFAALAAAAEPSGPAAGDISALLLAAILGLVYLGFMQLLVIWSSALPDKTIWYEVRERSDAVALITAAFLIGAALPFALLLQTRLRGDAGTSGLAGLLVLIGLALFWAWQVEPGAPAGAWWAYPLALAGIGASWLGLAFRRDDGQKGGAA